MTQEFVEKPFLDVREGTSVHSKRTCGNPRIGNEEVVRPKRGLVSFHKAKSKVTETPRETGVKRQLASVLGSAAPSVRR